MLDASHWMATTHLGLWTWICGISLFRPGAFTFWCASEWCSMLRRNTDFQALPWALIQHIWGQGPGDSIWTSSVADFNADHTLTSIRELRKRKCTTPLWLGLSGARHCPGTDARPLHSSGEQKQFQATSTPDKATVWPWWVKTKARTLCDHIWIQTRTSTMSEPQNIKDSPQEQCPNHKYQRSPLSQLVCVTDTTFPVIAYLQFISALL